MLGFGATVAEPALNALGITAEQLTNGAFKKRTLILAVSTGVAFGIARGSPKLIFDLPLVYMILAGYLLALALTVVSSEEFVNVAWDSAGVTTGPITVPLVLAMGLGFGNARKPTLKRYLDASGARRGSLRSSSSALAFWAFRCASELDVISAPLI